MNNYFQLVRLCESTYKAFLDSLKGALFQLKINNLTPIQALIVLNLGEDEINIKDFIRCGYYGGTNVTYNLNALVKNGYMVSKKNPNDLRSRKINLSKKGMDVLNMLSLILDEQNISIEDAGIKEKDVYYMKNNLKNINKTVELFNASV